MNVCVNWYRRWMPVPIWCANDGAWRKMVVLGRKHRMAMRCCVMVDLVVWNSRNIRPVRSMNYVLLHRRWMSNVCVAGRHAVGMRWLIHHNVRILSIRPNSELRG